MQEKKDDNTILNCINYNTVIIIRAGKRKTIHMFTFIFSCVWKTDTYARHNKIEKNQMSQEPKNDYYQNPENKL